MRRFWVTRPISIVLRLVVVLLVVGTMFLTANPAISAQLPGSRLLMLHLAFDPTQLITDAGMARLRPNGKVAPDLATWTVSRDHLTYTFTIRRTARFSNGHPVTAQDAEFTLKQLLSPSLHSYFLPYLRLVRGATAFSTGKTRTLSGVTVLGVRTLRIAITKPVGYFLLTEMSAGLVYDRSVGGGKPFGDPSDGFKANYANTTCIGNQGPGPFKFVCRDHSSTPHSFYSGNVKTNTFVPNPYYYGPKPHIRIQLRDYGQGNGSYTAYLKDKVDAIAGIPEPYINRWRGKSSEFRVFPTPNVNFLTPNVHLAPFDNVHCRLAVAYAIDRDTLLGHVLGGLARPTYAIVPKGILGYYPGKDNPHYDLQRARAELAKCPGRITPVDLTNADNGTASRTSGDFLVRGLAAAGFNVKLKLVSRDEFQRIASNPLDQSKTQLIRVGWFADYPDPQNYCSILLRSGQERNIGNWRNSTYDRLVDQADRLLNRRKRAALYIRAQHIALSQGAFISIGNPLGFALIKPYVHGMAAGQQYGGLGPKNGDWSSVSISKH